MIASFIKICFPDIDLLLATIYLRAQYYINAHC
jgi:hypothetical protein